MALLQAVQKAKMTAPNYDNMETIVNHTIFRWEHMPMSDSTLELDIFRNDCALPIANDGMRPKNRVQQYANQLTDTMKKVQDALGIDDLYSASASDF